MGTDPSTLEELIKENSLLKQQLSEANAVLHAIRKGEVDAFFVQGEKGGKVYVLEGAEHIYRVLVEGMQEGCLTLAKDGTILFCNQNFAETLKTPLQSLIGRSIYAFLQPLDQEFFRTFLDMAKQKFKTELNFSADNGTSVPALVSAGICHCEDDTFLCIVVTDLTEQKRSNRLNSLVFNQAASAMVICDQIGRVIKANPAAKELFGDRIMDEVFDRVVPLYQEGNGTRVLVREVLSQGEIQGLEVVYNKSLNLMVNASYLYGEQPGEEVGYVITLIDVSENRKFRREISRLDRLHLVGEMAAGIGHEVRNPMTTVRGYLQMFWEKSQFAQYRESINVMIEELDRANSIITEFLSLAKTKNIKAKELNMNAIIRKMIPLVEAGALRQGHQIKLMLQDIPEIMGDEKEIRQCILNLVRNGLEAMTQPGCVTVRTYKSENTVVLEVQDEGSGIPIEVQNKLGTPFFTTKDQGTGLGLPVCFSIAKRHGAVLDFLTGPKGTAFYIKFRNVVQQQLTITNEDLFSNK